MKVIDERKVLIERRNGVSLYGKVIDAKGRLGQFEVESEFIRNKGEVYHIYAQAEFRMNFLIGVRNGKQ